MKETKWCPCCSNEKLLTEFTIRKTGARVGQPAGYCKACRIQKQKAAKVRDPSIYRRVEWPSKLKRLYGITPDDYYRMLAAQGGGCGICGAKSPGGRKYVREGVPMFQVDHCHATGRVRGVLCNACNSAIGLLRDNPQTALRAAEYLK